MRKQASPYSNTLYIWNGVSAFFFSNAITPFHSHNTLQLVFDLRASFKCRIQNGKWQTFNSAVIKEEVIHQLDTNESVQLILYLDATSAFAHSIISKYLGNLAVAPLDLDITNWAKLGDLERCLIEPNQQLLAKVVHQLVITVAGCPKTVSVDKRLMAVLSLLRTEYGHELTIEDLARNVFLSPSRLRSLFKSITGFPLHRYLIWNRIMIAVTKILNGATISDAAYSSGFSDISHLHKMLLQMFGVSPSQFIKKNSNKKVFICDKGPFVLETRFHNEKSWEVETLHKL